MNRSVYRKLIRFLIRDLPEKIEGGNKAKREGT